MKANSKPSYGTVPLRPAVKYVWVVVFLSVDGKCSRIYVADAVLARQSVDLTYCRTKEKPLMIMDKPDYLMWKCPDKSLIEAIRIEVKQSPDHL